MAAADRCARPQFAEGWAVRSRPGKDVGKEMGFMIPLLGKSQALRAPKGVGGDTTPFCRSVLLHAYAVAIVGLRQSV